MSVDASSVVWTLIDNEKLANQIARLETIVVKCIFLPAMKGNFITSACMQAKYCQLSIASLSLLSMLTSAFIPPVSYTLPFEAVKSMATVKFI